MKEQEKKIGNNDRIAMKTRQASIFLTCVLLAAACSNLEEQAPVVLCDGELVFTASVEDETKTSLQSGGAIIWSASEQINMFYGNSLSAKFTSTNDAPAASASFSGTFGSFEQNADDWFYAVYPYRQEHSCKDNALSIVLPQKQEAVADGFANNLFISAARTKNRNLAFRNVCGGVKFSLLHEGVKQVELRAEGGEALAGQATVAFGNDGIPSVKASDGQSNSIIINAPYGTSFSTGVWYYIVCLPTSLSKGFTLTFKSEHETGVYSSSTPVEIKRGIWGKLGNVDEKVAYEESENDLNVPDDNEIWYTSTDGSQITPYATDVFGANLVSNTLVDGKWVLSFDAPVTTVGYRAFYNLAKLATVSLPSKVTQIADEAFRSTTSLQNISLQNSVKEIGTYAFRNCTSLSYVVLPASVTSIGSSAFLYCSGLSTITILAKNVPSGVNNMFNDTNNCLIYVPAGCSQDYRTAEGWSNYADRIFDSGHIFTGTQFQYTTTNGEKVVPNKSEPFNGKILSHTYENGVGIITVDRDILSVSESAFSGRSTLKSITLPSTVIQIGSSAFNNCSALEQIICNAETVPTGNSSMFYETNNCLIYVPASAVEAYRASSIWNGYADRIFAIGTEWSNNIIYYTSSDENIVTPYRSEAFDGYIVSNSYEDGQGKIVFDRDITTIEYSAFYYCKNLTSIVIPSSVNNLSKSSLSGYYQYGAFYNCSALKSITLLAATPPAGSTDVLYNTNNCIIYVPGESVAAYKQAAVWKSYADRIYAIGTEWTGTSLVYTSTTGEAIAANKGPANGNLVSNTYFDGKGTMEFDRDVETVVNNAFYNVKTLSTITLPASVKSIGSWAFYDCSNLTTITLLGSVPPTGTDDMFNNVKNLVIYVPAESVDAYKSASYWSDYAGSIYPIGTEWKNNVITYTSSDGKIVSPNNSTSFDAKILSNEYSNGKGIITFNRDVTQIGENAFSDRGTLAEIILPETLVSIGNYAFSYCIALKGLSLPKSLATIGSGAFSGCVAFKELIMNSETPPSVPSTWSFNNTLKLIIYVPASAVNTYRNDTFWKEYYYNIFEIGRKWSATTIEYTTSDGLKLGLSSDKFNGIILSENVEGGTVVVTFDRDVTSLENYAFADKTTLTGITLPNSLEIIGDSAFSQCIKLQSVTVPNKVRVVGINAFYRCSALKKVSLPEGLVSLGNYSFSRCSALPNITLPETLQTIGESAFRDCDALTSITIPNSVTSVGANVFDDCNSLETVTLSINQGSIPSYAFDGCKQLTNITIPGSISSIGNNAFTGCTSLPGITIPDGVTSIGSNTFEGCTNLTEANIGKGITTIPEKMFYGCTKLSSLNIGQNVSTIGNYAFYNCKALVNLTLPDKLKYINTHAFDGCNALTDFTFPQGLTTIGAYAFNSCVKLNYVDLPASLTGLYEGAFKACTGLQSVTLHSTEPPTAGGSMFDNTNNCPIYVPSDSVDAYKEASLWIDYASRIKPIE